MKKTYNPFKLLYRKFGLKKIIIALVAVIFIFLPSILAIFLHIDSNKMLEKNASDSLTVIVYDKDGNELYYEQGKTENYKIEAKKVVVTTHFPFINKHGSYSLKMYQFW